MADSGNVLVSPTITPDKVQTRNQEMPQEKDRLGNINMLGYCKYRKLQHTIYTHPHTCISTCTCTYLDTYTYACEFRKEFKASPAHSKALDLKRQASQKFSKKRTRAAKTLYKNALLVLRPPDSESKLELDVAETRLLRAQLHSNVAICAMMLGQLAESLRHTEESLEALKAISDTDSTRQKLIDKNNLRKTTLSRLSASIVKTQACASGSLVNSLPHGRASQVSDVCEYFFYGHDQPESAVKGISPGKCNDIAIFFGGCSDCRHVFATLFDLRNRFGKSQLERTRIELCDIQQFCFAR